MSADRVQDLVNRPARRRAEEQAPAEDESAAQLGTGERRLSQALLRLRGNEGATLALLRRLSLADRFTARIVLTREGGVQRAGRLCRSAFGPGAALFPVPANLYRRESGGSAEPEDPAIPEALRRQGRGEPLPEALLRQMSLRFGVDLDKVRVHTDSIADAAARAVAAMAFTVGEDIFFQTGAYAPDSPAGQELIAHELTHVVQGYQGRVSTPAAGLQVSRPGDALEKEAREVGERVASGAQAGLLAPVRPPGDTTSSAMVLRDDDKNAARLDPGMLKVTVTPPTFAGKVRTEKEGQGADAKIHVISPGITATATVDLADGVTLGGSDFIRVGFVQTLMGSERIGVYKQGDQVVAERALVLGPCRDAAPGHYSDDTALIAPERPFFSKTSSVSDNQKGSEKLELTDAPSFRLPCEHAGGKLAEIKGTDRFVTSVGAKREKAGLITLNPFGWSVDWGVKVADDGSVAGDAHGIETHKEAQGVAIDSDDYAVTLAMKQQPVLTFQTVEAALTQSAETLLLTLVRSRGRDPGAATNIEQALVKKNPAITVTVNVIKSASGDEDQIKVFAHCHKQSPDKGPLPLSTGASGSVTISLGEIIDPAAIRSDSTLSVWVGDAGNKDRPHLGGFAELSYPFLGSAAVKDAQGQYRVSVKIG